MTRANRIRCTLGVADTVEISMDSAVHLRDAVCLLGRFPALAGIDLDVATDVDAVLARAGIDQRVRDVIGARLSAGQRRRAALAILLARAPKLWLLDEPHAGLDAAGRDVLDAEIRTAVTAGATVVLASHELD